MDKSTINSRHPDTHELDLEDDDPIVAEVHRIREEILAEVGYDWDRLHDEIRQMQLAHPERIVSFITDRSEKV